MAIPSAITKQDVVDAMQYIDENGVPHHNKSTKYDLVDEAGNKYPPKYIVAVANHLKNGTNIYTGGFNAVEAKNFLEGLGFAIENRQVKYDLVITAGSVVSTDERFTVDDLGFGDNYKPLDCYFKRAGGEIIHRNYSKGERRHSNQTLPRLACQVFERQLATLSVEEKEDFPICQYTPGDEVIRGIFSSEESFKKYKNSMGKVTYNYDGGRQFIFYSWNLFSTLLFVQECLKRFGDDGDEFVLTYREKEEKEAAVPDNEEGMDEEPVMDSNGYTNPYSYDLLEAKNIIFRGAPGTGKTYLAKEIAADIISEGYFSDYTLLSEEQKKQIEFVQFHPSYDYTDFVEGLRPKINTDGSMGFELQDGVFKRFVVRAQKNFQDAQKPPEVIEKEASVQEMMEEYFSDIEFGEQEMQIARGTKFHITDVDEKNISISIPENNVSDKLNLKVNDLREMLESGQEFAQTKDVTRFFGKANATQQYSYYLAIFQDIKAKSKPGPKHAAKQKKVKPYIFIIDEINRGEISKIFGELFYSIDPGYRGSVGQVSTQYANLHDNPEDKFYIPENVYIIGTMNDIDRSVDSFDFAMRRRFRFVEIQADERLEMLDALGDGKEDAIHRMTALNEEISKVEELNANYHIGAAYFLKLKTLSAEQLWTDCLLPLLQDYVRGMYDEEGILKKFAKAYKGQSPVGGVDDGGNQA